MNWVFLPPLRQEPPPRARQEDSPLGRAFSGLCLPTTLNLRNKLLAPGRPCHDRPPPAPPPGDEILVTALPVSRSWCPDLLFVPAAPLRGK